MKMRAWQDGLSDKEETDLAYWERNMLALRFADGWYNDDVLIGQARSDGMITTTTQARFIGWRRVLSVDRGRITFHIPDDFDVGNLPQIERNWDGHTTIEKWERIAALREIEFDD